MAMTLEVSTKTSMRGARAPIRLTTQHGAGIAAYWLPNDGDEQDRQDFTHAIYMMLWDGRLHLAPLESPKHVLDIGTGTGIWAISFAKQYPDSSVVGTDLSLIRRFLPSAAWSRA